MSISIAIRFLLQIAFQSVSQIDTRLISETNQNKQHVGQAHQLLPPVGQDSSVPKSIERRSPESNHRLSAEHQPTSKRNRQIPEQSYSGRLGRSETNSISDTAGLPKTAPLKTNVNDHGTARPPNQTPARCVRQQITVQLRRDRLSAKKLVSASPLFSFPPQRDRPLIGITLKVSRIRNCRDC